MTAPTPSEYDAFLSYAHRDRQVTTAIQKGLHQIGRRLGQLRALRVFRDDTNLTASPDLWARITDALDASRFMIVVLSPQSAASHWVNEEVSYWLQHRGDQHLMLVLAEGQLLWDQAQRRFDPDHSNAAPPALTTPGSLPVEPLYIDVSADAPWDLGSLVFRDKVTSLAAPIHGKPKDQLSGDDLREQRRFRRLRAAAVAAMAVLTVVAVVAAFVAVQKQQEANARLRDAVVAKLNAEAPAMLAGLTPGGDVRAIQELLAANAIQANGVPILNAQIARFTSQRIIDTGSRPGRLAYSPDGRHIATAQSDGTVRQWDTASGAPVNETIKAHTADVHGVAYTRDGRAIASAGNDGFRLSDATTGATLSPTEPRVTQQLNCVAVSADGDTIVTGDNHDAVQFWDAHNGRLIHTFDVFNVQDKDQITIGDTTFDRSGNMLAINGFNSKVAIYDAHTGEAHQPSITTELASGHSSPAWQSAFSPDGHTLAIVADELQLWNPADTTTITRRIQVDPSILASAFSVAYSPDGRRIATGRNDGAVQLWDADTGEQLGSTMVGHTGMVIGIAFSPDGRQLATTSSDGTLRLWSATVGQLMRGPDQALAAVGFSPDGHRVAASGDTTFAQWNLDSGLPLPSTQLSPQPAAIWFQYLHDGTVVVADSYGAVAGLNPDTGQPLRPPIHLPLGDSSYINFALSSDGRTVAWGSSDGATARLTDVASGRDHGQPMTATPAHPGEPAPELAGIAFSPDGHHLAVSYDDGLRLWNADTTAPDGAVITNPGPPNPDGSVAYSRDGSTVAVGHGDGTIELWDLSTHRQLPHSPLRGHTSAVHRLAFGPGHQLASVSSDRSVRLWDTATGLPTAAPITGKDSLTGVAISNDGRLVASITLNGTLLLSPAIADPTQLCDKLQSNMTKKQWSQWVSPAIDYITVCPKLPTPQD